MSLIGELAAGNPETGGKLLRRHAAFRRGLLVRGKFEKTSIQYAGLSAVLSLLQQVSPRECSFIIGWPKDAAPKSQT